MRPIVGARRAAASASATVCAVWTRLANERAWLGLALMFVPVWIAGVVSSVRGSMLSLPLCACGALLIVAVGFTLRPGAGRVLRGLLVAQLAGSLLTLYPPLLRLRTPVALSEPAPAVTLLGSLSLLCLVARVIQPALRRADRHGAATSFDAVQGLALVCAAGPLAGLWPPLGLVPGLLVTMWLLTLACLALVDAVRTRAPAPPRLRVVDRDPPPLVLATAVTLGTRTVVTAVDPAAPAASSPSPLCRLRSWRRPGRSVGTARRRAGASAGRDHASRVHGADPLAGWHGRVTVRVSASGQRRDDHILPASELGTVPLPPVLTSLWAAPLRACLVAVARSAALGRSTTLTLSDPETGTQVEIQITPHR